MIFTVLRRENEFLILTLGQIVQGTIGRYNIYKGSACLYK